MTEEDENILEFRVTTDPPIVVKPYDLDDCKHRTTEIDPILRRITCQRCNEQLDPIQVLIEYATHERSLGRRIEELKAYEARLDARQARRRQSQ